MFFSNAVSKRIFFGFVCFWSIFSAGNLQAIEGDRIEVMYLNSALSFDEPGTVDIRLEFQVDSTRPDVLFQNRSVTSSVQLGALDTGGTSLNPGHDSSPRKWLEVMKLRRSC